MLLGKSKPRLWSGNSTELTYVVCVFRRSGEKYVACSSWRFAVRAQLGADPPALHLLQETRLCITLCARAGSQVR